jgi:hypothetical protein
MLEDGTLDPFRYFDSSPEVIRLVVMMYVRYPLSLRNVEGACQLNSPRSKLPSLLRNLGTGRP